MYLIIYFSRKNSALNSAANFSKVLISPEFSGDMVFFCYLPIFLLSTREPTTEKFVAYRGITNDTVQWQADFTIVLCHLIP